MSSEIQLKRPIGVYLLAILFILAPLGNLLISFSGSGDPNWLTSEKISQYLTTVQMVDWLWLGLLFISGLLLLIQHKTAWTISVISLILVLCLNTYRFVTLEQQMQVDHFRWQMILAILATMSILVIAFYFRYPYLDRRTSWFFGTQYRLQMKTPVQVLSHDISEGVTESISLSGASIMLKQDIYEKIKDLSYVDVVFNDIRSLRIKSQIIDYIDNHLRVKFEDMTAEDKSDLRAWIEQHQNKE